MSLPTISLGRTGGRFACSVNIAWLYLNMAVSELGYRKPLVGSKWAIFLLLCMDGLTKQSSHLEGAYTCSSEGFLQS